MPLKKRSGVSEKPCTGPSLECFGEWGKKYPALCEFLSSCTYEDGASRDTGTVNLSTGDGRLRVCLNDKDLQQYCFLSGENLDQVLKAANRAVAEGIGDWRQSDPEFGKGKKKRGQ